MYDLLIIGGGINGCAIARDAAGRGLKVSLIEQGDLAGATSSSSTKLIHGGLRYLEQYEFRLVHESLAERESLLASAPHIIWPLKFIIPYANNMRPKWLIKLGLWLYDNLSIRKKIPQSESVKLRGSWLGSALKSQYTDGFAYWDCWVDDSRLVVFNALDAQAHGADIRTRTKLISAERFDSHWRVDLDSGQSVEARVIVNASGPWVNHVNNTLGINSDKQVKLVKGSHIVIDKQYVGNHAYLLQNPDNRIVFVIPYENQFTLVGTTDVPFSDNPGPVSISSSEQDYLLESVNRFWKTPVTESNIVWSYAGLRPLFDDGSVNASVVTRDYAFDIDTSRATVLSVFGGKITTARRLAEHALLELKSSLPAHGTAWTESALFSGGYNQSQHFLAKLRTDKPFLSYELSARLARTYGTKTFDILGSAASLADLGENFGSDLTEAEVKYLVHNEWAQSSEDILWRRTKLGLQLSEPQQKQLERYIVKLQNTEV